MTDDHENRIKSLETRQLEMEKTIIGLAVELKHIGAELEALSQGINRLVLAVMTTGIGAIILWIMNGGMAK